MLEDLARQIAAIKDRYPDFYQDPETLREAAAVWGIQPNSDGVWEECQTEVVARHGRATAKVQIAKAGDGVYTFGIDFLYRLGGCNFLPSLWREEAYATYQEAKAAGIRHLLESLPRPRPGEGQRSAEEAGAQALCGRAGRREAGRVGSVEGSIPLVAHQSPVLGTAYCAPGKRHYHTY